MSVCGWPWRAGKVRAALDDDEVQQLQHTMKQYYYAHGLAGEGYDRTFFELALSWYAPEGRRE